MKIKGKACEKLVHFQSLPNSLLILAFWKFSISRYSRRALDNCAPPSLVMGRSVKRRFLRFGDEIIQSMGKLT